MGVTETPRAGRHIEVPRMAVSRTVLLLVDFINPLNFPGARCVGAGHRRQLREFAHA